MAVDRAKIQAVNELLRKGEPENISVDEHTGYTGYKPQSVVDAMNEVLWGEWGFIEISNEILPGDKGGLAVAKVEVWLKDNDFHPTGWGQNRVTRGDAGDAHKGAQTDAIKKALSYFSIGNRAYHGMLPDKKEQAQQARSQEQQQRSTRRPQEPAPQQQQARSLPSQQATNEPTVQARQERPAQSAREQQAQAKQPDLSINSIIKQANKYYAADGGWEALRGYIIRKHDLGDIPDEVFTQRHREEMAALITTKARQAQPATADK